MRPNSTVLVLSTLILGCSANASPGLPLGAHNGGGGSGGGVAAACVPTDGCSTCATCLEQCLCLTADSASCPAACGEVGPSDSGGSGGAPPEPPPSPPSGGAPASGGSSAGGGSPGGGGTGASSGGACTYPAGPYGKNVGDTLPPTLFWQGFAADASQSSTLSAQDFFDCDGSRGVNALLLSEAAVWCGACQEEASDLNGLMSGGWKQKGIAVVQLVIETASGDPASVQTASAWKDNFNAQGWAVVADPGFSFSGPGSNGLPLEVVVDPRTMKIVDRQEGYGDFSSLEQLASTNASK